MFDCSKIIEKVKPSVGMIIAYKGKDIVSQGSGFAFWKKGILVSCNHVIDVEHDKLLVNFSDNSTDGYIEIDVAIQDKEHDLALLKFDDDSVEPLAISKKNDIIEGIPVIIAGYPLNISTLTTHCGIISAITEDATGIATYLLDGTVSPGNSGCPLLNQAGEVIGVVNATRREDNRLLSKVGQLETGALSVHGLDIVQIYQALIKNLQLGIGYAIPCSYIPKHKNSGKA